MNILGIDLGTTNICALVVDEDDGNVIETVLKGNAFLPSVNPWDRMQDPERIFSIVIDLVSVLMQKYKTFRCIGVSSQMHGILYVNEKGMALSPFYTWQDQCASQPWEGESYAEYLARFSPSPIATGYGLASCFYQQKNNSIPSTAVKLCGIGDYIVMRLCNESRPAIHPTNAAGMGFFNIENSCFYENAAKKAGLETQLLPDVWENRKFYGETNKGIPVAVSIGDNQASFLGAVKNFRESISVNIGTSGQISFVSSSRENFETLERRPFFDGLFLLVGASLCGGRAYAILETFFHNVLVMAGSSPESLRDHSLYEAMENIVMPKLQNRETLTVNTLFAGTRKDHSIRGSITGISENNFTPQELIRGFLDGIAEELYRLYLPAAESEGKNHKTLTGSGNAIRNNKALRQILSEKFNMPLQLPPCREEAAKGAALFALSMTGHSLTGVQQQLKV